MIAWLGGRERGLEIGESLENNSSPACPATEPTLKKRASSSTCVDVNEDFLKFLSGGYPPSAHTAHYINPLMSANPYPCCQCGQAVNLFLKELECRKNCYRSFKIQTHNIHEKTWMGKTFFWHCPHQHLTSAFRIKVWVIVTHCISRHTSLTENYRGKILGIICFYLFSLKLMALLCLWTFLSLFFFFFWCHEKHDLAEASQLKMNSQ